MYTVKWVADLLFYSSDADPPGFLLSPPLCSAVSFLYSSKNGLPLLNFQANRRGVGVNMHQKITMPGKCSIEQNPENGTTSITSNIIPGHVWADHYGVP